MIDLEDLQARWQEQERKLDVSLRLNAQLLRELKLDKARAALARLAVRVHAALAADVLLVAALAAWLAAGRRNTLLHVSTLALIAFLLWSVVTGAAQAARLHALDYAAPVLDLQKQLARLRLMRIHKSKWILLLAPLLWTPLFVVGLGLLGFDAGRLGATYLLANVAFGVACIPALLWLSRRPAVRRSRLFGHLADDLAGRSLVRAQAQLASLAAFEQG